MEAANKKKRERSPQARRAKTVKKKKMPAEGKKEQYQSWGYLASAQIGPTTTGPLIEQYNN